MLAGAVLSHVARMPAGPPGPQPPLPPGPPPAPGREHHDLAAELVTLIGIGVIVSGAIAMAVLAIYTDSQRSQERIKAWADGAASISGPHKAQTAFVWQHLSPSTALLDPATNCTFKHPGSFSFV